MANLVQHLAGPDVIVRPAHMELAEPTIAQGFAHCVEAGASEVVALPYMVSPGRHSIEHIPEMVAEAARPFPEVSFRVTAAFGVHEKLAELILVRTGISGSADAELATERGIGGDGQLTNGAAGDELSRCWHPNGEIGACGDACRARDAARQNLLAAESL